MIETWRFASVAVCLVSLSSACRSREATRAGGAPAASAPAPVPALRDGATAVPGAALVAEEPQRRTYGAPVGASGSVALSEIAAEPDRFAGRSVIVEGHVRRACTRRGCWMELVDSPQADGPRCRVTFKDYAFFVPIDSAGATARVEGISETVEVSAERVAHLESEGAQFARKRPDGSAEELHLVATGVELWRKL